jgi:hypothetical protein
MGDVKAKLMPTLKLLTPFQVGRTCTYCIAGIEIAAEVGLYYSKLNLFYLTIFLWYSELGKYSPRGCPKHQ